jgi:hypothetical protein
MREDVDAEFSRLFEQHHRAQLQFDADERIRIKKLLVQSRNQQQG